MCLKEEQRKAVLYERKSPFFFLQRAVTYNVTNCGAWKTVHQIGLQKQSVPLSPNDAFIR
jgi:hypothetical protein